MQAPAGLRIEVSEQDNHLRGFMLYPREMGRDAAAHCLQQSTETLRSIIAQIHTPISQLRVGDRQLYLIDQTHSDALHL